MVEARNFISAQMFPILFLEFISNVIFSVINAYISLWSHAQLLTLNNIQCCHKSELVHEPQTMYILAIFL